MRKFCVAAAITLLTLARCGSTRSVESDLHSRLEQLLSRYEEYGFSGTVLVAKDDRVVLHRGYGFADEERGIRNDTQTLFEVGSLNKTFTAAAILQLEAQDKLRTSDPLSRFFGPFPPEKATATIHHLATHTSGLVADGADVGSGEDREKFIEAMKTLPAESVPGEKYRYTNAGYSLLAAVIERVSSMPYETYIRRNIIPLTDMKDVYFRGETIPPNREARGYLGTPAELKQLVPPPAGWGTRGAGGLITTVADLHRWYVALRRGRVLPEAELNKMFYPWPQEGYAWSVGTDADGRQQIRKGGGMPQYATQVMEYPDEHLTIVWASNNLRQRWRQALNRGITAVAFGMKAVTPPPRVKRGALESFAGRYMTADGRALEIAAEKYHLYVLDNDLSVPVDLLFFPTGDNEFTGFDPTKVLVTRMEFEEDTVRVSFQDGQVVANRAK